MALGLKGEGGDWGSVRSTPLTQHFLNSELCSGAPFRPQGHVGVGKKEIPGKSQPQGSEEAGANLRSGLSRFSRRAVGH